MVDEVLRRMKFRLRRLQLFFLTYDHWRVCQHIDCPEVQVGYSQWCRKHTDMILNHKPDGSNYEVEVVSLKRRKGRLV